MNLKSVSARGFTLLEVVIALAILVTSLVVLTESQASSVMMTAEADRLLTATYLAKEKMNEVMISLEVDGFGVDDIEEEGDFNEFGADWRGVEDAFKDAFPDYHWAYVIRKVELELAGDPAAMVGDMAGEEATNSAEGMGFSPDDFGFGADSISGMLDNYIREVRVIVWWGDNEDETDQVELVSHAINPTGVVNQQGNLPIQ